MTDTNLPAQPAQDDAELFRLLVESVKDYAIFVMNAEGRIVRWNTGAERLLGYKAGDILGQPFASIFTAKDVEDQQPEHELRTAAEKGRSDNERWHVRRDGSEFWASGVVTPLWDRDGRLRGYAKIMRDITDRKMHELALAEANHRKDDFLAMLAHELRNPLAPILNAVHVLHQDRAAGPEQRQAARMIERQARQLTRLVDDLLDVSRIARGKIHLRKERVRLVAVVQHAVDTVRPLVNSRKHELTVSLPPENVWLEADPARLEQVFANLLTNAAKYTEPGGHIWLTVEPEGTEVVIRVRDTGIGIVEEMLPRVFDLFIQADRSLDRAQGGLGIGLTLVRSLVQMHEGTVTASSAGIGKGSEFVVRLPVVSEVSELKEEAIAAAGAKRGRPLRLLVVDDNVDTAESLSLLLRLYGHEVAVAHTGPSALQQALAHKPDAVMLDIGLPGLNGYEVAQRLREHAAFRATPLIALTGYGQDADKKRSRGAGFNVHLVKPIDPERLQDLLAGLVPDPRA
jgi:PAS domain S-box-containing protein